MSKSVPQFLHLALNNNINAILQIKLLTIIATQNLPSTSPTLAFLQVETLVLLCLQMLTLGWLHWPCGQPQNLLKIKKAK